MNSSTLGLLVSLLPALGLVLIGAVLFFMPRTAPPLAPAPATGSLRVTSSVMRDPAGLRAVITAANGAAQNVRSFHLTRVSIAGMSCDSRMPFTAGAVHSGVSTTVAIPFRGPAPAPNSWVHLDVDYTYETGLFGKGSGNSGVTSLVP